MPGTLSYTLFLDTQKGELLVSLSGEADMGSVASLREHMDHNLAKAEVRRVIFDCQQLVFTDSQLLGIILRTQAALKEKTEEERPVAIRGANHFLRRLLRIMGIEWLAE